MAHIESFKIDGLAGSSTPIERTLHRTINVFWGPNGGGKTSLLRILHGALENDVKSLRRVPFDRAEVLIRVPLNGALYRRTLEMPSGDDDPGDGDFDDAFAQERLVPVGDGLWQEVPEGQSLGWTTETIEGPTSRLDSGDARNVKTSVNRNLSHAYLPISRLSRPGYRARHHLTPYDDIFSDQGLDDAFAEQVTDTWRKYMTGTLSSIQRIQQKGLAEILATLFQGDVMPPDSDDQKADPDTAQEVVSEFLAQQHFNLVLDRENFRARYASDAALPKVVAQIREVQREIEQVTTPQETLQSIVEEMFQGKKHLQLTAKRLAEPIRVDLGGKEIPLQSLSSGEKQLIRLLLEVLSAKDMTVMIDEPELSMHVDWQRRLVDSMQQVNPHCQLLLATHSPEIVSRAPAECVFEL